MAGKKGMPGRTDGKPKDYSASMSKWQSRFWPNISPQPSGCWHWTGSRKKRGYGSIMIFGRNKLAHRVMYELAVGQIPEGMQVNHLCDNPMCVNPIHLVLGTHATNARDCASKCRFYNTKLKREKVLSIRNMLSDGVPQTILASAFGVNQSTVSRIKTGERRSAVK